MKLDIISGAVDFEDKTRAALLLKQPVEVQCLWQMGPMTREFRRGRKFYSLIVIQTSLELGKERVIDFSKQPLIHLFSSVFLQRSHIEVYLGIHVPLVGTVDGALLDIANASGKAKFEEKESIENNQPLSRSSTPQGANLTAIKTILKGKVDVSLPLAERMFQTIYLSVLLLLIDLKQTGILVQNRDSQLTILELHEELLQIYTFLHGITSQLFSILNALENIQMLQEASTAQALKTEVTQILLKELRELSENVLNMDTANFSYDLVMLTSAFKSRLQRTAAVLLELQGQEALTELRMTQCYGLVLAGQFLDGVLPWLPGLDGFMQECRPQVEISRNRGGDPEDKEMTSQDEESASGSNHIHPALDLLYYKDSYLDSGNRECAAPESGPGELVFLLSQYLLDCRLDQVWERCLKKILSTTPPSVNPYSILVTEFWKASLRLDLWHSPDENIMEQIFLSSPKMLNPYHPIMSVPGATGFGLKTALKAVNPSSLQGLLTKIALVDNYSYPTKAGSFKVALGLALHPLAAWYKSLNPFLLKLEVTEFCYLTGPDGCLTEALQIYAKLVHSHLCELAQNPQIVSWTIIIRGGGTWSSTEIQKYPTAFQEAFFESLQSRSSAVLKVFAAPTEQEWRCVPIVKNFVLYYLQTGKKNPLCFPKHDPTILYQCVFSSEQAADFHYKHVAPSGDPYCAANLQEVMSHLDSQIIQAFAEGNLLDSYRLLASRALICGQYECLPACWRMLHSISAQLEYLNSINTDIQEMFILNEGKEVEGQSDGFRNTPQSYDKMMEAFSVLLERTLTTQGCMICHSLQNIILRRIQMINAGRLRRSSIEILKEISTMCQAVSDVSAWHLHALCPEIQRLHQSVKAGASFLSRATVTSAGFESTRPPMLPYSRKNEKVPQTYPTVYQVLEDW
ncbi:uncharacterized protein LOC122789780 [Protopterus annectens]|uniref:uncharacterized protein LOC122789780 n=1 Tax=Protopterus annectens TaxID=7888 RepID=UPI001CF9E26C|nr:uncharacterized protein LOC122789780 [Protopterus annectens]